MNYCTEFKEQADLLVLPLSEKVKTLSADLLKIIHRLDVEKGDTEKLKDRIIELKKTTDKVVADQNAYATFKVNLRKLEAELEASQEAARLIENEVLPVKQRELDSAAADVKVALDTLRFRGKIIAVYEISELVAACINSRQSFLNDFKKLYSDYGCEKFTPPFFDFDRKTFDKVKGLWESIGGRP